MALSKGQIILLIVGAILIMGIFLAGFIFYRAYQTVNWARTYTEETGEARSQLSWDEQVKNMCKFDARIKLLTLQERPQICISAIQGSYLLNLTIINDGAKRVDRLNVRIIGTGGIHEGEAAVNISVNGGEKLSYSFIRPDLGEVQLIRVTPLVSFQGQQVACSNIESVIELNASSLSEC